MIEVDIKNKEPAVLFDWLKENVGEMTFGSGFDCLQTETWTWVWEGYNVHFANKVAFKYEEDALAFKIKFGL